MDKDLKAALDAVYRAAWGDSNDQELGSYREALEIALSLLGVSAEAEKLRDYVDEHGLRS